jgi:signal recognition particle GTPase
MHPKGYDPAEHFEALADDREAKTGRLLLTAADTFREAVIDALEAWEDEREQGQSIRRPIELDDVRALYGLADAAVRLARSVERSRALSYILATAEAV